MDDLYQQHVRPKTPAAGGPEPKLRDSEALRLLHFRQAHTTWGLLTRIAAKIAAYNCGLLLNRLLGRPNLALATLIA